MKHCRILVARKIRLNEEALPAASFHYLPVLASWSSTVSTGYSFGSCYWKKCACCMFGCQTTDEINQSPIDKQLGCQFSLPGSPMVLRTVPFNCRATWPKLHIFVMLRTILYGIIVDYSYCTVVVHGNQWLIVSHWLFFVLYRTRTLQMSYCTWWSVCTSSGCLSFTVHRLFFVTRTDHVAGVLRWFLAKVAYFRSRPVGWLSRMRSYRQCDCDITRRQRIWSTVLYDIL